MKIISCLFLIISIGFLVSCSNSPQQAQVSNTNTGAIVTKANENSPLIASSHGAKQSSTPPATTSGSNSGSSSAAPVMTGNATAIDTSEYDAAIAKAEKDFKAKSKDETAKKALADAYAKRAFALTQAAQYRAALGDFRKSLKLDPKNEEARAMHDQIVDIFKSLNREPPAEGAEPTPLPFKKES
ncbi:MAG: tetratricopeptide repeat protein [Acidobacteriota bacterium]|nr:tetratricopeptide repeat protein [Acidobacteriota bacterium]